MRDLKLMSFIIGLKLWPFYDNLNGMFYDIITIIKTQK